MLAQSLKVSFRFQLMPALPPPARVENCVVKLDERIEFDTGTAEITHEDAEILQSVVEVLKETDMGVIVEGHTDDVGSNAANQVLSEHRAAAVADWLAAHGVPAATIRSVGRGEIKPAVPNTDDVGRYRNRRVEFRLVGAECPDDVK